MVSGLGIVSVIDFVVELVVASGTASIGVVSRVGWEPICLTGSSLKIVAIEVIES